MKKVLVTGSSGFIAQHVIDELLLHNTEVIGIDKEPYLKNPPKKYHKYCLDINSSELESIFKDHSIEYIIHLAANSSVPNSVKNPIEDAESNYLGSIRLCELAKKYGVKRILAASTAAVYAHPRYLPVKETHPPNCLSPYAISKQAMEYYITLSGVDYTIFRFSNVYGPGQNNKGEAGVVAIFADAMGKNEDVKIYGDGEQTRDFIYVKDVARAIVEALLEKKCTNMIMNISSNSSTTINELYRIMKEHLGYKKEPIYLPQRESDIRNSVLDNSLAKETFNFRPQIDLKTGLKETVKLINTTYERN